jgi:hypothetical protein
LAGIKFIITSFLFVALLFSYKYLYCNDTNADLAVLKIRETTGRDRILEYVTCSLQISSTENQIPIVVAVDQENKKKIPCQIFNHKFFSADSIMIFQLIFPISIKANEKKEYILKRTDRKVPPATDLSYQGKDLEIRIDNKFYSADLSKSDESEAKSHRSGQLRELFMKMGFDISLFRTENRMHWAPNFQNAEFDGYETIAGWDNPNIFILNTGPYLIHTMRQDVAPRHPEILLTANYYFYAGLPYFRFHSSMEMEKDIWLFLLRNDEMTMNGFFTHIAFQRSDGTIEDYSFSERYKSLDKKPIENDAPWLCFYNSERGYAFGSIRIKYNIKNRLGSDSPTYLPHTKISDGSGGGKYWNRRLINERPTFVPEGSRYMEENIYLLFSIDERDKFRQIIEWSKLTQNPVQVTLIQYY